MSAQNVIESIVSEIISELEKGAAPWNQPWTGRGDDTQIGEIPLRHNGEKYRGINVLALWLAAMKRGYQSRYWLTYKQATALGGQVRKGEKSTGIIYADQVTKRYEDDAGNEETKQFSFLKTYCVFNADQIEGLPELYCPAKGEPRTDQEALPGQDWLAAIPATIIHGGDKAFFSPGPDYIRMPNREQFRSDQAYTSVLIHELTHWTGGESRLNRIKHARWGDEAYAFEELVAELGAAFGCAHIGLIPAIREDHAPYIASWIKQLKSDPRALMQAASKASTALDYLDKFSNKMEIAA